jgi:hypothetical protein
VVVLGVYLSIQKIKEIEMKKILPMILLLLCSMPVFAEELKLVCTTSGNYRLEEFSSVYEINFERGTINGTLGDVGACRVGSYCSKHEITDIEISLVQYNPDGKMSMKETINRITGDFKKEEWREGRYLVWRGSCSKFKQAF